MQLKSSTRSKLTSTISSGWPLEPKPHRIQEVAFDWLANRHTAGILLDQGLGKTAVMLADNVRLLREGIIVGHVVVCPNTLKENWKNEAIKFGVSPSVPFYAWPETVKDPTKPYIFAINYEACLPTAKGAKYLDQILRESPCMVTLDESIRIKNPQSKTTRSLIALGKRASYRRILSGKPMTQGAQDLWAQLRFIEVPETLGSFYGWRNRFCVLGGFQGKQIIGLRQDKLPELHRIIDKHCIRATKADWTDLPKKVFTTRGYELSREHRKMYDSMCDDLSVQIGPGVSVEVNIVLTQLMKLQQISSGFIYDENGKPIDLPGKNAKLASLLEALEDLEGKALVMAYFGYSCTTLLNTLEKEGYNPSALFSKARMKDLGLDQQEEKNRFDSDPTCRVKVVQIDSGKYGHTLLGDQSTSANACRHTYYYENIYSLDARAQSEDRNHRWGQEQDSVVYTDFVGTPVEAKVISALQRKDNIVEAVVEAVRYRG